jgi:hypothetical protein
MLRKVLVFESIQIRALKKWLSDGESCEDETVKLPWPMKEVLATSNLLMNLSSLSRFT